MNKHKKYWLALNTVKGIGSVTTRNLLARFKTPEKVFAADSAELCIVKGVSEQTAREISSFNNWKKIERELEKAGKLDVNILTWEDGNYPEKLLTIPAPPPVIYTKGKINEWSADAIAVVGSRNASQYGLEVTDRFCKSFADARITVVSGLARGIDTAAHKQTLKAKGKTLAVLGSGLDVIYPAENRKLFDEISENGAVISEFPLGTAPDPGNFPRRNRIISGLSFGVLVVEASFRSGSLITARYALEFGREVYAVPGNITSQKSKGTNGLIKEGARLVAGPEEILEEIIPRFRNTDSAGVGEGEVRLHLNEKEGKVFSLLGSIPLHIDQLLDKSGLEAGEMSSVLLQLELLGAIRQHPGKFFSKSIS